MQGQHPMVDADRDVRVDESASRAVVEPGPLLSWARSALLGRFPDQDDDARDELHILRGLD